LREQVKLVVAKSAISAAPVLEALTPYQRQALCDIGSDDYEPAHATREAAHPANACSTCRF
jgi:hypothetical protein